MHVYMAADEWGAWRPFLLESRLCLIIQNLLLFLFYWLKYCVLEVAVWVPIDSIQYTEDV